MVQPGEIEACRRRKFMSLLQIARCRPQLTTSPGPSPSCDKISATKKHKRHKTAKDQNKFSWSLSFCAFCAFLWLSPVLHARLGVFLKKVTYIYCEAL